LTKLFIRSVALIKPVCLKDLFDMSKVIFANLALIVIEHVADRSRSSTMIERAPVIR